MNDQTSELTLDLAAFEGPLDLLLHLIKDLKVDIFDIPKKNTPSLYILLLSCHLTTFNWAPELNLK